MKSAISAWSFPFSMPLEEKLRLAATAGFKGFEIDLTTNGPVNLLSDAKSLAATRQQVEKHGLQLSGLATLLYWEANAASNNSQSRARAAEILERQLHVAADLGIDTILVVPGAVGVDFIPNCEVVPYDLAYTRALHFIRNAVPLAERLGVTIGIENVWNKFLLSPREMASFIDECNSPRVRAYLDVANTLAFGYPEHWISILGPRIARVHFKDYRRQVGTADGFVELLSGDVNWPAVVRSLRQAGYDGWCAAEIIPPVPFYKYAPEILIENTGRALRAILALT